MAAILANPAMIKAYLDGAPGNGKPFPDGARMARSIGTRKKWRSSPRRRCQALSHDVDFMVKDSKRFADSGRVGIRRVRVWTRHPTRSDPVTRLTSHRRGTTPRAGSRVARP